MRNVRVQSVPTTATAITTVARTSRRARPRSGAPARGQLSIAYVRSLEEAVATALEQCWEGKLPFQALEDALRRRRAT